MIPLPSVAMPEQREVPSDVLAELRSLCLGLPEVDEEEAWVGTRWKVRNQTFAHVLVVHDGWPPAYASAAGSDGTVLTFRSSGDELDALTHAGPPFFKPVWFPDIVGLSLGDDVDWDEVAELVTESYCVLAPQKLVARIDRPAG
jgi:hypothetical protein